MRRTSTELSRPPNTDTTARSPSDIEGCPNASEASFVSTASHRAEENVV